MGEENLTQYTELAERFFELDNEVYEATGSETGKVFPGVKNVTVNQILQHMIRGDVEVLKDGMTLMQNMIMTLDGQECQKTFQQKYDALYKDLEVILGDEEALRDEVAKTLEADRVSLMYKKPDQHVVICIARETGSGGMEIGYRLAKRLGYSFYNDTVLKMQMDDLKENFFGLSGKDLHYIKQSRVIENAAKTDDCVIVGRSAGHVLQTHNIPRLSVFIGAPLENRIQREMLLTGQDRRKVTEIIRSSDRKRKTNYNYYTGKQWGNPSDFDICINSACYGIEGSVEILKDIVQNSLSHLQQP